MTLPRQGAPQRIHLDAPGLILSRALPAEHQIRGHAEHSGRRGRWRRGRQNGGSPRRLDLLHWGLIPSWIKDLKVVRVQPIERQSLVGLTLALVFAIIA